MIIYECDYCKTQTPSKPSIILNGVVGISGGILLPAKHHEKTFCSDECFWKWAKENTPFHRLPSDEQIATIRKRP